MLRRPNQRNAGPTPLGQLLSPRLGLGPSRPNNSMVGARQNLPSSMGYGSLHPHPVEGSQFTGGRVANPAPGLVPQASQATFAPHSAPGGQGAGGVAPSLAALGLLTPTPHGGPPTGPVTSEQPTDATGAEPSHARTPAGAPGSSGGVVHPPPPLLNTLITNLAKDGGKYNPYTAGPSSALEALLTEILTNTNNTQGYVPTGAPKGGGSHGTYMY